MSFLNVDDNYNMFHNPILSANWPAHRPLRKVHVHACNNAAAPANHSHIDGETRRDACQPTRHYDDSGVGGNNRLNYVDLPQSVSFTSLHLQWYVLRFKIKITNGTWRSCFLEPKSKKIWDSKCLQKCEFEWNTLWFADGGSMTAFAACRAINTGSSRRNRNRSVGRQQSHSLIADGSRSITFVGRHAATWKYDIPKNFKKIEFFYPQFQDTLTSCRILTQS